MLYSSLLTLIKIFYKKTTIRQFIYIIKQIEINSYMPCILIAYHSSYHEKIWILYLIYINIYLSFIQLFLIYIYIYI